MFSELMNSSGLRMVWSILREDEESRNDDRRLFHLYYQRTNATNNTEKPNALQSQIRRWRHKVQYEIDRSLRPRKEVEERRKKSSRYFARGAIE